MDRLTQPGFDMCADCLKGVLCEHIRDNSFPVCGSKAIYDRLAAYEDTGLTPEEIEEIKKDAVKMRSLIAAYELNGCIGTRQLQLKSLSDEEKQRVYMGRWNIPKHPCEGCGTGWGSANSEGVHTCEETCEKLAAWNEQQIKEENHGTTDTKE